MSREIPLSRGLVTIVDDEDYEMLVGMGKWFATKTSPTGVCYPGRWTSRAQGQHRQLLLMHRVLCPSWSLVDHKDQDGLNNQRSNLRPATNAENTYNCRQRCDNTSGYRGVTWAKHRSAWYAQAQINGVRMHLGSFATAEDAAAAYDAAILLHHGAFARPNFPLGISA